MSDDISRSIASAVSQVVQLRAVDQALTINRYWSPKAGKNASEQNFSLPASTRNGQKEHVCRTGDFANTCHL